MTEIPAELDINLLNTQLMDIYQPESVSWWPLAPAWWLLLLLVVLSMLFLMHFFYQKMALRRAAIKELKMIESTYQKDACLNQLALALNMLLRRVVMSHKTLNCSPGLSGQSWLAFLDQKGDQEGDKQRELPEDKSGQQSGAKQEFSQGVGKHLLSLPYQKDNKVGVENQHLAQELIALVRHWVRKNT